MNPMIRFKTLYKDFNNELNKEVDLGKKPAEEDLLPPLDEILATLHNSVNKIHKLQDDLVEDRDYSVKVKSFLKL